MNRKQRRTLAKRGEPLPAAGPPALPQVFDEAVRAHQSGRLPEAELAYRQILASDPHHAGALHLLGVIAHQVGQDEAAIALIQSAIQIDGNVSSFYCNLGNALKALGRTDEALEAYNHAIGLAPSADAYSNLGNTLKDLGRYDEAIACFGQALAYNPEFPEAYFNRGNSFMDLERWREAALDYTAAIRLKPDYAEAFSNYGNALKELGRNTDAIEAYNQAIRANPGLIPAYSNLGNALKDQGNRDQAVEAYRNAIRLAPDFADAHSNMGNVLLELGQAEEAVAAYQAAIAANPDFAEAYSNLGNALKQLNQFGGAIAAYETALRLKPTFAEAHSNLGTVFKELGRLEEAIAAQHAAIAINPDFAQAYSNLGNALKELGRLDEAIAAHQTALRLDPDLPETHSNLIMSLHYRAGISGAEILAEALRFGERFESDLPPSTRLGNVPDPERRLRIGYVSGDFGFHPVGFFLKPVLRAHDRSSVEIFGYSNRKTTDEMAGQLRHSADHWRSIVGLSDEQAASLVRSDGIDILVDLSGHTALNRLGLFARRPAPIQVSWLGFWGTTGLAGMGYVLSDSITVPPDAEKFYSEQVIRLPGSRFCYAPPDYAPQPAPLPLLHKGSVTFGSFNNLSKVGPEVVSLWAAVLQSVPGSRLLLKWKSLADAVPREQLTSSFARAGIDKARLELRGASDHLTMLQEYGEVDIALDPFPFSGGLTSCEALWMGVPVVTLPGSEAPSRQTLGFLQMVGLSDLAARDAGAYAKIAADLAADPARLAELRTGLRARMAASPLCDGLGFTRGLEQAFRDVWRRWCSAHLSRP